MGRIEQQSMAWKSLIKTLDGIVDPILKNSIKAELTQRAITEWGYNPNNGNVDNNHVNLNPWEEEFIKDINRGNKYQLDTRSKKRQEEERELKTQMYAFIKEGGELANIPSDIRTEYVAKIYLETLKKVYEIE